MAEVPARHARRPGSLDRGLAGPLSAPADEAALTLVDLFERAASRHPERVAIRHRGATLTYAQLDRRADHLALRLRDLGVRAETLVGLRAVPSSGLVVGMLGILKAGGAYVPLPPALPAARAGRIVEDAGIQTIVTQAALGDGIGMAVATEVRIDPLGMADEGPDSGVGPENAAYVIHTSGSTGRPKGVVVGHRNVVRLFAATAHWFGFTPGDTWTLFHSYAFDFSVFEVWGALLHGGCLVIVDPETARDPASFLELLEREGVTILCQTPSAFRQLARVAIASDADLALRTVVFGGEALDFASLRPWLERFGDARPRLVNMYGITETTVHVTYRPITTADAVEGVGSRIGIPIPDMSVYLLDPQGRRVPRGAIGEMFVGGAGLARGYLGQPELERERFVPDPFSGLAGARLYRSGDLARELPDGDLEFCGRSDDQVQIRGYRVEPGEVASAIREAPGVRDAAVVAGEGPEGVRLIAYVVPEAAAEVTTSSLLDHLRVRLPDYMVPAAFVSLDALPLTANGKLDRSALPPPARRRPELAYPYAPPRTTTERLLAAIWQEVLRVDRVGRDDSFFDLGGHSLLATAVAARASQELGCELPVADVLASQTLAGLATAADARSAQPRTSIAPLSPGPRDQEPSPLSASQERVWFMERLHPTSRAYRSQAMFRFRGVLDIAALERALSEMVRRHEIYRTTFPSIDGRPVQQVHDAEPVRLTPVPVVGGGPGLDGAITRVLDATIDLATLPLARWTLFELGRDDHVLLHAEHHLLHDGWSFNVFAKELAVLYSAYVKGEASPLPEPELRFTDFARWQRGWLAGEEAERQAAYWRERLAGSRPTIPLPYDRPRPAVPSHRGAAPRLLLPADLCRGLRALSRSAGTTLFMTMLAALAALLQRVSGQTDLSIGTGIANRRLPGTEGLIGMIINNVVLRCDVSDGPTFLELLARVRETALGAYANQDLPFDRVVEALEPRRDLSRNPLFQVAFSFQDTPLAGLGFAGLDLELDEIVSNRSAKFDLNIIAIPRLEQRIQTDAETAEETIRMVWEHSSDLFDSATIERLMGQYERLLGAVVEAPATRLSEISLTSDAELAEVASWGGQAAPYPRDVSVHRLFERQVGRTPDAVALELDDVQLSYRDLDGRADELARRLRGLGVGPGARVGLLLERSLEVIVAMLAVLKAGAAYVPLEPRDPPERLAGLASRVQVMLVLTVGPLRERIGGTNATIVCLDVEATTHSPVAADGPFAAVSADSPAYIMFTSGSTGDPKGVLVPHRAIVRLVTGLERVTLGPDTTLLQMAPLSFDAATFEVWGALASGARLVLFPGRTGSPREIGDVIRRHGVTTLWLTAPLFHQIVEEAPDELRGIRQLLTGGDVVSATHVRRVLAAHPGMTVIDGYGPTEATTFTTSFAMQAGEDLPDRLPIGRPLANTRVHVLDGARRPVGPGIVGELWIGGDGLALGYVGAPEATAERFVPDPFADPSVDRLYRSGDLARWRPDGTLEFLGRIDRQVKVHGTRVEPAEIEAALGRHASIHAGAVRAWDDGGGDRTLVAYVVFGPGEAVASSELRAFLESQLPSHLVPSAFVMLDRLPLDDRGKVDHASLPAPLPDPERRVATPARDPIEELLVAVWREVLGRDGIGIHDDFFDLGGHSLMAMMVVSRIEARLGTAVSLRDVLETATVAALADRLRSQGRLARDGKGPTPALERLDRRAYRVSGGSRQDATSR